MLDMMLPFMLKFSCFVRPSSLPEAIVSDAVVTVTRRVALLCTLLTVVTVVMPSDPQIIKRSIAYRAKYRAEGGEEPFFKNYSPLQVVPHPTNRGGVPVTSLRTKQLIGTIVKEACDDVEAGKQPWMLNNTALKSICDSNERPVGVPIVSTCSSITNIKF